LDFYLAKTSEIALLFDSSKQTASALVHAIHKNYLPNTVVLIHDQAKADSLNSPLLEQRNALEGKPTAYICQNYACQQPITDLAILQKQLSELQTQN
jgi:uncharacterized protein